MTNSHFESALRLFDEDLEAKLGARVTRSGDAESAPVIDASPPLASVGLGPRDVEAIILEAGRPALLIRGGTFEVPVGDAWALLLAAQRAKLEAAVRSVGRVEIPNHLSAKTAGTAWMIAPRIAVTNRHVAEIFSEASGADYLFTRNTRSEEYQVYINFGAEYQVPSVQLRRVTRVLWIAPPSQPDIAFLELEDRELPPPLLLGAAPVPPPQQGVAQKIAVIGFPQRDDERNDPAVAQKIFADIYRVKRLSPGEVMLASSTKFMHDASTLGGSSGSVVLDLETGHAVGLHFSGTYKEQNYAVSSTVLREKLSTLLQGTALPSPRPKIESLDGAPESAPVLNNRSGYRASFLGNGAFRVGLPGLDQVQQHLAVLKDGTRAPLLYQNYSVVMNASRRIAYFSAANLDGALAFDIKRVGPERWYFDERLDRQYQLGGELYYNNELDRGHLTRRLDPAWGADRAEAVLGERDTFFWTNCAPQYSTFNQHTWLGLEDYVLERAKDSGLKVSVFTGPVFKRTDPLYREVRIPRSFWKIVAVRHDGRLSATAYVLSQADLISDLEIIYGEYETYQVPLPKISALTKLDFSHLYSADPLNEESAPPALKIRSPRDLRL